MTSAPADAASGRLPVLPNTEEGATSRINFRLPERLDLRIEEAAGREGLSVNAWLVRAVAATLAPDDRGRHAEPRTLRSGQSYTGWVR
ncbi:MAG: toxin-antitoxin system HicB family antitoxin [Pseudonocardiaceae bacterium]